MPRRALRLASYLAGLIVVGCQPAVHPIPGVSEEVFEGPGDRLSPAERAAFQEAANAVTPNIKRCIEEGYDWGIASSDVTARLQFRRDGRFTAIGFKIKPENDTVASYLSCLRNAIVKMELQKGPWEADRKVVYRFTTTVRTTWD